MSTTILRLVMLQEHIDSNELLQIVLEIYTTAEHWGDFYEPSCMLKCEAPSLDQFIQLVNDI
jgi:hypothetical protein